MTLRSEWVNWCIHLACEPEGYFWSGARKILANRQLVTKLDETVQLEDIGYTPYKIGRLNQGYFVQDAFDVAMMLHQRNVDRKKYASAAFHCYGHLLKAGEKRSKRASQMGPCIQAVVLTLKPHERRTRVDVFYRTTEAFKKLPADFIWLRDYVLKYVPGQDQYPIVDVNFHFVNVTVHPMYVATAFPMMEDPIATLQLLRNRDRAFWQWTGKWTARYLIGGAAARGIEKFAQAQRVAETTAAILRGPVGDRIIRYLCDNREHFMPSRTGFTELNKAFDDALRRIT